MKIHPNNINDKIDLYASEAKTKRISNAHVSPESKQEILQTSKNEDEILFSESAVQFARFKEHLSMLADVRHDKVAELQSRIQNGSYQPDSEKVAEKIIEESSLV
jgi:flagellar biosynthesis anti-sigma factor FlgM